MCDNSDNTSEMQEYIDISPYRDTLGVILYRYIFKLYRYIEYCDISMYHSVSTFRLYTYMYSIIFMINALVVYCGCQFYSSATI